MAGEFLFRQDAQRILFWGRIPALLLSLGMASLVAVWATHLRGWAGGLLALFLYAPTITAQAQLVTTDVGVACFSVLYLWSLRSYLGNPTWRSLLFSGLALGLALGAKFSAVVLIPISVVLLGVGAFRGQLIRRVTPGWTQAEAFACSNIFQEEPECTEPHDAGSRGDCLGYLFFPERSTLLLERHSSGQSGSGHAALFLFDGNAQASWPDVVLVHRTVGENAHFS